MNRFSISAVGKRMIVIFLAAFFTQPIAAGDSPLQQVETGMHDLIYRVSRSVVAIEASRSIGGSLPGFPGQMIQSVASTGLVCDSAGHILANASCVVGFDHIQLTGEDRSLPARVLAVDYQNDLALLATGLPVGDPVTMHTDPGVCVGRMVLSLNAANGLRASPSIGFCAGCRTDGFLQFSLPVGPASAGGGVFDLSGRLIGVILAHSENQNSQATAMPSYKLPEIINHLLTKGTRRAGFAGIATRMTDITPPLDLSGGEMRLTSTGSPQLIDQGVVVTAVMTGSPAARAGIMPGDLVLSIGEHRIESPDDVARIIMALEPSTVVGFKLFRRDRFLTTHVRIDPRPSDLVSGGARTAGPSGPTARSKTADSLLEILNRLHEEVSRVERRLQSID